MGYWLFLGSSLAPSRGPLGLHVWGMYKDTTGYAVSEYVLRANSFDVAVARTLGCRV